MRTNKIFVTAIATVMLAISFASLAAAEEEPAVPVPIQYPLEGQGSVPVAVYFADNMAFGPQWRVGNLVRIETAVINLDPDWDTDFADTLALDQIPVELGQSVSGKPVLDEFGVPVIDPLTGLPLIYNYTQTDLMTDPNLLNDTYMVSVSEITIRIYLSTDASVYSKTFYSYFVDGVQEDDVVTMEINKGGHLIYGFLWDTEGIEPGVYNVEVTIPGLWDVMYAVQHAFPVVVEEDVTVSEDVEVEPIGYEALPIEKGGVDSLTNTANILLGELIDKSEGGSTGGGDNGDHDGGGGNMNGQLGTVMGKRGR